MLLTDDGDLAHRLTHPRYHVPKTYFVQVEAYARTNAALAACVAASSSRARLTAPAEVELLPHEPDLPPRPIGHPEASRPPGCGSSCTRGRSGKSAT